MRIVIGTRSYLPGFTHVDIDPTPLYDPKTGQSHPVDVVCDARDIPLPDGCAEHVRSREALEHFPWGEYRDVLAEWARLVGPGGTLRIEVPDALAAYRQVLEADTLEMDRAIQQIIFGGQSNQFDYHYVGLTPRMLTEDMEKLGLEVVEVRRGWNHGWLLVEGQKP
jgi:ubiquinone/menaquinone biosynthesis C-methylase UbiE